MIGLRNAINKKEICEHKNPNKLVNIVQKILDFNKRQKDKGLKILTFKQLLQRLLIPLAQIKLVIDLKTY